jgi:Tol biopolymer transport system component
MICGIAAKIDAHRQGVRFPLQSTKSLAFNDFDFRRLFERKIPDGAPEWTPDGKSVLFRSQRNGRVAIWKQLATGAEKAEMLYEPEDQVNEAIMSPDERWLVYRAGPAAKHPSDISAVPLSGDRKPVPIATGPATETMPRLSPDGKWLAYEI